MTNTLSTITTKQQEILKLIYRYRFLSRTQIQVLLEHKDKRRIISWLKDLRDKQYVDWHYDATDFIAKAKPAIYYLSLNGIRYLREVGGHPGEELRKRYKEPGRTQVFIDRCLLMADCCIALQDKSGDTLQYTCILPSDYSDPASRYYYLKELKPHLLFSKQQGGVTTTYLLEYIGAMLPRYQLRKQLKDYVEYLTDIWDENSIDAWPTVLFICPTTADLLYVKRRAKILLDDLTEDEEPNIRVTTVDKVRTSGVTAMIWEEI